MQAFRAGGLSVGDSAASISGSVPGLFDNQGKEGWSDSFQGRSVEGLLLRPKWSGNDHMRTGVVASHEDKNMLGSEWAAHPWPLWTLESTPPNAKPIVRYCLRHPFLLWVAFHGISFAPNLNPRVQH